MKMEPSTSSTAVLPVLLVCFDYLRMCKFRLGK